MRSSQLRIAQRIARYVHKGQLDRAGLPVLRHLERVAAVVRPLGPIVESIAWLHDSIEDAHVTACMLRNSELWDEIVDGVVALTRNAYGPESYMEFVRRACQHPLARYVKRADLMDNLTRVPPTDPEDRKQYEGMKRTRYPKALALVEAAIGAELTKA